MPPEDRQRTDPGVGGGKTVSRERTVLGTGVSPQKNEAQAAPIVVLAPTREKTVLGIAPPANPAPGAPPERETSLQEPPPEGWDLAEAPGPAGEPPAEPPPDAEALPMEPEASIAIDLVRPRSSPPAPLPAPALAPDRAPAPARAPALAPAPAPRQAPAPVPSPPDSETSLIPAGVPRHRGRWLLLLLVLAVAAGVGYVRRDSLRPVLKRWQAALTRT